MARKEESGVSKKDRHGFVPVVVVRTRAEAEEYCQLFSDHDIPAKMGDGDSDETDAPAIDGVPVLVEEDRLDEAKEIIADREDLEEFQAADDEDELDDDDDEEDFHFVEDELGGIEEDDDLLYDDDDEDELADDDE